MIASWLRFMLRNVDVSVSLEDGYFHVRIDYQEVVILDRKISVGGKGA